MQLIADSGSTKTVWHCIDGGKTIKEFFSTGINPFYQTTDEIASSLRKDLPVHDLLGVDNVYFYGAGCANDDKNRVVSLALEAVLRPGHVFIGSDLLGAARSLCQHQAGIACILGTGSNSCYYDGMQVVNNVSPLGFILGDEGSGAVMGKKLVADILKKQMPEHIIQLFFNTYSYSPAEIVHTVYREPFPNRFLAQFSRFLVANIHEPEIERLVENSFDEFILRNILQYPESSSLPIHFTGSIASNFSAQLTRSLGRFGLKVASIVKLPIEQLVRYHTSI